MSCSMPRHRFRFRDNPRIKPPSDAHAAMIVLGHQKPGGFVFEGVPGGLGGHFEHQGMFQHGHLEPSKDWGRGPWVEHGHSPRVWSMNMNNATRNVDRAMRFNSGSKVNGSVQRQTSTACRA